VGRRQHGPLDAGLLAGCVRGNDRFIRAKTGLLRFDGRRDRIETARIYFGSRVVILAGLLHT
jgi:hypothetical protein